LNGARRPLFNQKELAHMDDVQKLFGLVRRTRMVAGSILLILPLLGLWFGGSAFFPRLGTLLAIGGGLTVALLALTGLASLVDFTEAFTKFHELAFSNDDWMLEGFWLDATLRIAMYSAIEGVVLGVVGLGIRYFGVRR